MTIASTVMGVETSGGHNILQGNIGDVNNRTGNLAQGYFQITTPTWTQFGGAATGYPNALSAPYSSQFDIAQNIPVARWGPNTQTALRAAGYQPLPGETMGQMMNRYGESPADTVAADGSTYNGGEYGGLDPVTGQSNFDDTSGLSGYSTDNTFSNLPDNAFDASTLDNGSGDGFFDASPAPLGQGGVGSDTVAGGDLSPIDYGSTPTSGQYSSWLNQQTAPAVSGTGGIGSDTAASGAAPATSGNPISPTAAAGSGQSASTAPSGTNPGGAGKPESIVSDQPEINAANTITKGVGGLTSGIGSDTTSIENAGTGWLNNIFSAETNTLVRGGFLVAGVLAILGAFMFFYLESNRGGSTFVPIPV